MNIADSEGNPAGFTPKAPHSLEELDIPQSVVADLMLRRLYKEGKSDLDSLGRSLRLSFRVVHSVFQHLREQKVFEVTGMSGNNYSFCLTYAGRELAEMRLKFSQYCGPAPVSLQSYTAAVNAQIAKVALTHDLLRKVLSDLVVTEQFLDQIGPALISQSSLFLYGPSGNGKTSIAVRLQRIYGDSILIPYAVECDGQIIVLYDPAVHCRVDNGNANGNGDPRWVTCERPCIVVGGELDISMLELQLDANSGVYAAPVQMKANNGILVIDDFGRQLVSPRNLLNRWILPLDRHVDYLALSYGMKFQVPFALMVVFATNLDPRELADEAFMRRIRNKVYVEPCEPGVFDDIFDRLVSEKKLKSEPGSAEHLRTLCVQAGNGELRACYPVDILNIIVSISAYEQRPVEITRAKLERAASIYFTRRLGPLAN
ncbi:MAG: AAA family ATPase [Syntrophobacteraceae bacterium]